MPYNASLSGGQEAAAGDRISDYSAIPAPRGARDAGWRSLFCHYSLELLTVKSVFAGSQLLSSYIPTTRDPKQKSQAYKIKQAFPMGHAGTPCLDGIREKSRDISALGAVQKKQCTNTGSKTP